MMVIKWSKRIWLFLLVSVLFLPGTGSAYSNLYILGDSLSDTGNLFAATATDPLNQLFPKPLPQDPPYSKGRFSNGPIYAEYLWTSLGLKGNLKPSSELGGTDYAFGGARSRYHTFDLNDKVNPGFFPVDGKSKFRTFSLLGQRDAILSDYADPDGSVHLDPGALYTVWEGSNDVSDAIGLGLRDLAEAATKLINQAVMDLVKVVTDLVAAGARYLLIPNVPNLGLVPEIVALKSKPAQDLATALSIQYNDAVDGALAGIEAEITRLDTFSFLTDLVKKPSAFGFPEEGTIVDKACFTGFVGVDGVVCDNKGNYVFWDRIHPSAATHRALGALAFAAVPEPAPVALIALALLALGYSRKRLAVTQNRRAVAGTDLVRR